MEPETLFPVPPDPRIIEIDRRLLAHYGQPAPRDVWNPLDQFIYSLLSSRTKTEQSHQVMRDLRARFGTWENLRDAAVAEIEQTLQIITFPEVKAVWLKKDLMEITARCGELSLEFLAKYRTDKIRSW